MINIVIMAMANIVIIMVIMATIIFTTMTMTMMMIREGVEVMAGTVDLTVVLSVLLVNYK